MVLTLRIENTTTPPDGGPLSVTVPESRPLIIGRDRRVDWVLPDPSRHISGRHCEIAFRDGGFWLNDLSTNGTFVNGADRRVVSPYRLRDGDRLSIGEYVIRVVSSADAVSDPPRPEHQDSAAEPAGAPVLPAPTLPAASPLEAVAMPDAAAALQALSGAVAATVIAEPPSALPARADAEAVHSEPAAGAGTIPRGPKPGPSADSGPTPEDVMRRFAGGLGVPAAVFAGRDPGEVAERFGAALRLAVDGLRYLLAAHPPFAQAASGAVAPPPARDGNPLKSAMGSDEILNVMFGPATGRFMPAERAMAEAFAELGSRQSRVEQAFRIALMKIEEDLSPHAIEHALEPDTGLSAMLGSRKARLWEAYQARWTARAGQRDHGLVEAAMRAFAEAYFRQ